MLEDAAGEDRVDAIAGVQEKILAHVAESGGENEEEQQRRHDHRQRARGVMDDHLVDDDLGEQRRGERNELHHQRSGEHVAPDGAVAQELGHEPSQAERRRGELGLRRGARLLGAQELGGVLLYQLLMRNAVRRAVALGHQDRARIGGEYQGEPRRLAFGGAPRDDDRQGQAREIPRRIVAPRDVEPERGSGLADRRDAGRRRKLLQEEARLEGHVQESAQACEYPCQIRRLHRRLGTHRFLPLAKRQNAPPPAVASTARTPG